MKERRHDRQITDKSRVWGVGCNVELTRTLQILVISSGVLMDEGLHRGKTPYRNTISIRALP